MTKFVLATIFMRYTVGNDSLSVYHFETKDVRKLDNR